MLERVRYVPAVGPRLKADTKKNRADIARKG